MLARVWAIAMLFASITFGQNEQNVPIGPNLPPYFKLARHCEQEIRRGTVVGTSVAVIENGRVEFLRSFGHRKKNAAALVDMNTTFQLGSASKTVAATLFAIAQKQGRITTDTPVKVASSQFPTIEARHLLSHTSGFKRSGWNWQIEHGASRNELLNLFSKKNQKKPGASYDYHNVAFSLIEEPLAQALQMPFDRAVVHHIFTPLGMKRATVGINEFKKQDNRAWPHEPNRKGVMTTSSDYSHRYHDTVLSAGGVNASINDMVQFLLLQLGHRPDVLTASDLAAFHTPATPAPDAQSWFRNRVEGDYMSHYGLGFRILKHGDKLIAFHGGWLKGFTSIIAFSPEEQKGIVVLSNSESGFAFATAIDFLMGKFNEPRLPLSSPESPTVQPGVKSIFASPVMAI